MELARHRQRAGAGVADQALEAGDARRVEQHLGEGEVVLDDQQDAVAAADGVAVVVGDVGEDLALVARRCSPRRRARPCR